MGRDGHQGNGANAGMNSFSPESISKGANRKVRKLLGRAYLRENRIGEALEVYLGILKDFPGDADVLIILGNLYRLAGSPGTAEWIYRQVLKANPEDRLVEKHLALVHADTCREWEVDDALCDESMARLVERLQSRNTLEQVEAIRAAADLPERASPEDHPAETNGQTSEDAQLLLPALIAQNIRQARAAGYLDLAEALQSLQINLARQVDDHWADDLLKDE